MFSPSTAQSRSLCALACFPLFFSLFLACTLCPSRVRAILPFRCFPFLSFFFFFFFTPGAGEALLPRVTFLCVRAFARVFRVGCGGLDTRCLD
jgi:hypothetical protein